MPSKAVVTPAIVAPASMAGELAVNLYQPGITDPGDRKWNGSAKSELPTISPVPEANVGGIFDQKLWSNVSPLVAPETFIAAGDDDDVWTTMLFASRVSTWLTPGEAKY